MATPANTQSTAPELDASVPPAPSEHADPRTAQIRALLTGELDPAIDPQSLFDVDIADEAALAIERMRVRALLDRFEPAEPAVPGSAPPAANERTEAAVWPAAAAPPDAAAPIDRDRLEARLALDRARLEFYALAPERREAVLAAHAARRQAALPEETEAERRARLGEQERLRALAAARNARSEAERLVEEEVARLLGIERSVREQHEALRNSREALAARKLDLVGWQRRVREAIAGGPAAADGTYDAIRATLRGSRSELAAALDAAPPALPSVGPDPLRDLPAEIALDRVRALRARIEQTIREAGDEARALQSERTAVLLHEINVLNRERLNLLPHLSFAKRDAVTGFTEAGFDQARSEARHLQLVLRYHYAVAHDWFYSVRERDGMAGRSVWRIAAVVVPCLVASLAFVWWRRRSPQLVALAEARLAELERAERRPAPSVLLRGLRFAQGVQRSLEWLAFFGIMVWLLPAGARALLEVQLVVLIVGWSLFGALVVHAINALAAVAGSGLARAPDAAGHLRLRSLRLVGRVAVALFLILLLSARLVGKGTIYQWVVSVIWVVALVVFLVLVRWWRDVVFERVERIRRKSRLQQWVLANRAGWKSFLAAMIAAVQLFSVGSYKAVRNWLAEFDLARRAHAYLFKREIDRLAGAKPMGAAAALPRPAYEALSPEREASQFVPCPADTWLPALRARLEQGKGGVVATIGGRGLGKSTLIDRLARDVPGALRIDCRAGHSVAEVRATFTERARSGAGAAPSLVLLDDVHRLVKPMRAGLKAFDDALAFARQHERGVLWVFAIDSVVWPFLQRARDGRPLFDEVLRLERWTDEQIGDLLTQRSTDAGLSPDFEDLLEKLPPTADEIDKQEALAAMRAGYFRMVWDYARGNPGMALEVWRTSLAQDESGAIRVRPLGAPSSNELETLPDSALFILRAVLQMAPTTVREVAQVTRLSETQVENALRFGQAHGYVTEEDGRVRVTWAWLRSIVLLLERRRLLVNP